MKILNGLMAGLMGVGMLLAGGQAMAAPGIDLGTVSVSGLPGATVMPTITLPINSFQFESFDLDMVFDPAILTFLPASSTVSLNGVTAALNTLPSFLYTAQFESGVWHARVSSFTPFPIPVTGDLTVTGAFKIANTAPVGVYQALASGYVATDPVGSFGFGEEPPYSGMLSVAVVPEPEIWLLWLAGLGLLAVRRSRQAR